MLPSFREIMNAKNGQKQSLVNCFENLEDAHIKTVI